MSDLTEQQPEAVIEETPVVEDSEVVESTDKEVKPKETEEEREERIVKQQEIDGRSVYVGNVDYQSTPEQLESFFKVVGVIERITILFDRYSGLSKGYAYVEFEKPESVEKAINDLHGQPFRGREIRVTPKRTNLPGFRKRGGFRGGARGARGGARGRGGSFRGARGGRGRGSFRGRGRGKPAEGAETTESAELATA